MAQSFEITGTLKKIFETQTFASGFSKREFVVEVPDGNYPQMIKFEIVKDRISQLESHALGDEIKVSFDIRGNEYKERFYVNLNAWKIEGSGSAAAPAKSKSAPQNSSLDDSFDNEPDESDEIPF
ncbi:MAG: DUF3127 domain-containing protein [Akkermansiaceae bacterium]|jgi:hypothetical protein|nr:DUF3127 domain-containing protein [Akkermansiaceae bacterium]